ncbi:MAG: type II toxin-antitoxin system HipA family toxin YjjJ [Myxococcaceae bacterium]|nr:type II toxin-antitoxin system HipA family toxin YjjJ [Myxococcaceae bacterium]
MASVPTPSALLAALDRLGTPTARELTQALGGISQPTVSRLITAAGAEVVRMGRVRATRYARARAVEGLGNSQPLYRIDERGASERLGTLHLLSGGRHWLEAGSASTLFEGLPPFVLDLAPQGYLGRAFVRAHPELGLPPRISDWSSDHLLIAVARRVPDGPGQLILGREAFDAFVADTRGPIEEADYPSRATKSMTADPGSIAAGERPKFLAQRDGRHVLVKFADTGAGESGQRWADLLEAEAIALEVIERSGQAPAAKARVIAIGPLRFLEVDRFDRVGPRGRRGTVSLAAYDDGFIGAGGSWSHLADRMQKMRALWADDLRAVRWLETFGQLIANSDRHRGNLSFFVDGVDYAHVRLAPVYDMLPMHFAPREELRLGDIPEFIPAGPTAYTADVWLGAAEHAIAFWRRVSTARTVSPDFRGLARAAHDAVARLRDRVGPKLQA